MPFIKNLMLALVIMSVLLACQMESGSNMYEPPNLDGREYIKYKQYYVQGQKLYTQHCSNCHQENGKGLGKLFPSLAGSDYMKQNLQKSLCGMKYGMNDTLTVNDTVYTQSMPGNDDLTNLEIAEIATYIYNSWGNEKGMISSREVEKIMKACNQTEE